MRVPFYRPSIGVREVAGVSRVLKSGWLTHGPVTVEFEKKFAQYIGCKHAVAVNSCTSALFLSLLVSGVKAGDEVITTPFTFVATANEIIHLGAKPVFADILEDTFNISPGEIERRITSKTKAILPVHYGGNPCDMDEIRELAGDHNLLVVEDAAHAIGSKYRGRRIGSFGNLTCFSFSPSKNMTTGEGGMVTLGDSKTASRLRLLRLYGINKNIIGQKCGFNYEVLDAGYKLNMSDINSAIGLAQLKRLDNLNGRRDDIAARYSKKLASVGVIKLPKEKKNRKSSNHLYPILLEGFDRNLFVKKLDDKGVGTSVHFIPLHLQPFFQRNFSFRRGDFPVAERVYERIVSLPLYPSMANKQVDYVCDTIKETLGC